MPDSAPTSESRLKRRAAGSGIAVFVAGLVVLVLIGFFASHSGIDKKLAEKRLAEWVKTASQMASEQGYVLTLHYDAIEIEGSLFSKKAAVKKAVLTAAPSDSEAADKVRSLSTDVLYLDPDMLGGGLSVIFTEPLLYTTPEGRTRIVAGEPIEMVVEDYSNKTGSGLAYTLLTPPHLSMERLGRQSDAVISTTDITFGKDSKIYGMVDRTMGTYRQEAQLKSLGIKRNDRTLAVAAFDSTMETASQNGALLTHYEIGVNGLTTNGPLEPLGALNASLDVEYEEPALVNGEPLNLSLGRDRNITLEKLLIESSSGKMLAKARLRQLQNEIMPFGNATVQIEHPVQLLEAISKTGYLSNMPKDIVTTMLTRVTPEWKGDDSPITIPLKREQNGPFYVGSLTFEEFTAVLLSQLIQQSAPELPLGSPQTPAPTDGQTAAPVEAPADAAPDAKAPEAAPAAPATETPIENSPATTPDEAGDPMKKPTADMPSADEPGSNAPAEAGATKPE
jgi:hypothetical protein